MKNLRIEAVIVAVGLVLLGWCLYLGLAKFATGERVVSVRGLAEREVKADYVIWPVVYKTTGNDLQAIHAEINRANGVISAFLRRNGVKPDEISVSAPQIVDLRADRYNAQAEGTRDRYNVTSVITVASHQVDRVRSLMSRVGELLREGIAISDGGYENRVEYEFTSLNSIKPKMIEEATRNAREAARQFATDSDSELGKIKKAPQGLFSIESRDQYTPYIKKVRVVTSVDYFLNS